jgi:hypothetical protein
MTSGAITPTLTVEEAQREQRKERGTPAEVLAVLAVECAGEEVGVGSGLVALGAAGAAATLTAPLHRVAVARETETMAEQATTEHPPRGYSEAGPEVVE